MRSAFSVSISFLPVLTNLISTSQLADQYGTNANDAGGIDRSRSNLQLETVPSLHYNQGRYGTGTPGTAPLSAGVGEDTLRRF